MTKRHNGPAREWAIPLIGVAERRGDMPVDPTPHLVAPADGDGGADHSVSNA